MRPPGRQAVRPQPPSGNFLARIWQKNKALLANAGSLYASTIINSVLGFAFWALAARVFTTSEVGFGSAAVSAMGVLSSIGMFGLNTLLIGELPKRESKGGLIWAALLTAGSGSFILGLGFALVARQLGGSLSNISSDPQQFLVFVGGVTIIGMSLVFDEATIGMLRGRLQLWRNFVFVITKLLLLPVAALFLHDKFGAGIVASWVAGAVLSIGIIALQLLITGNHVFTKPDWGALKALSGLTLIHNWLNLAISVPWMILPVLVTITVGPSANAAFYIAWMVSAFLRIIPIHLATVLFAVASEDMKTLGPQLRFSLRVSMLIGIPAVLVLCLGSPLFLALFGASYAKTGVISLILLSVGYLPSVPTVYYITVCRATGQISRAARILTVTACLEIAAAVIGGKEAGLVGFGIGVLAIGVLQGLITAPSVLRAARSFSRHRRAHRWVEVDRGESVYRRYRREYI
jgi:O-antigen/teichoic acid export membrane protein